MIGSTGLRGKMTNHPGPISYLRSTHNPIIYFCQSRYAIQLELVPPVIAPVKLRRCSKQHLFILNPKINY